MKFYNSVGPNPRAVRMFMAEKGLDIAKVEVDLMKGENRQAAYTAKNTAGQMPCLELDDGTIVAEITAICEYLEDTHPRPASPREYSRFRNRSPNQASCHPA